MGGTHDERNAQFMCHPCAMDAPVRDGTGRYDIDFTGTFQHHLKIGNWPNPAHAKARQVIDLAGFLSGCGDRI